MYVNKPGQVLGWILGQAEGGVYKSLHKKPSWVIHFNLKKIYLFGIYCNPTYYFTLLSIAVCAHFQYLLI